MKTYLTYGFATALAGMLLTLALFFLGFHSDPAKFTAASWIGSVAGFAISAVGIVLGTKARRAEIPATESFGYGRALGAGVMIALFAAVFGTISHLVYVGVINPGMTDVSVQVQIEKLEASGMSATQVENAEAMMRKMMHPGLQGTFAFIGMMFFGTLISLVTAAFLKRPAHDQPPSVA